MHHKQHQTLSDLQQAKELIEQRLFELNNEKLFTKGTLTLSIINLQWQIILLWLLNVIMQGFSLLI